jgi:hypothetical protein
LREERKHEHSQAHQDVRGCPGKILRTSAGEAPFIYRIHSQACGQIKQNGQLATNNDRQPMSPVDPDVPRHGKLDAAQAAALLISHPAWAIWLPQGSGEWTAVRPASSRPPGPGQPLLWAQAATVDELTRKMHALDEQVSPGGWP